MRHWQSLVPSVICVRPLRCDSITPPSSALFKSFKKYLKSFFFVLWKRDDFTRSPGRAEREVAWPTALVRRCIVVRGDVTQGRGWEGALWRRMCSYTWWLQAGWISPKPDQHNVVHVWEHVCVCVYAWRCVTSPSLHRRHLFIWNKGERTVWGQCFVHNFNFRFLNVSNTTQNGK